MQPFVSLGAAGAPAVIVVVTKQAACCYNVWAHTFTEEELVRALYAAKLEACGFMGI